MKHYPHDHQITFVVNVRTAKEAQEQAIQVAEKFYQPYLEEGTVTYFIDDGRVDGTQSFVDGSMNTVRIDTVFDVDVTATFKLTLLGATTQS